MPKAFSAAFRAIENVGASFLSSGEIIRRMTKAEQPRLLFLSRPSFSRYFPDTSTTDARPIRDLRTI